MDGNPFAQAALAQLRQEIAKNDNGIVVFTDWDSAVAYAIARAQTTGWRWRVQNAGRRCGCGCEGHGWRWETIPAWLSVF